MKLFGFEINRPEQKAIRREDILSELAGNTAASKSGARVNWKTALQITTAFACARVIADGLAQVPFKLYQDLPAGGKRPAKDHSLYDLLASRPNDRQTSFEFREQLALHLVFCGEAFVWKNRAGSKTVELLAYEPNAMTVKRDGWMLRYLVTTQSGRQIEIPADEMWHIRGPSWDGFSGLEAVKLAREALGLALVTEEHSARMFSNGARVGGILTTESTPKPEDRTEMRKSWQETYGGVANAFKTALLWGGIKYQPMGMLATDAQLLEQRRFQIEEVCRFARVLPIMIGHYDKAATFASAEQMFLAHVVHTLGPWYARLEQSADANLLTDKERERGLYFKFLPQALMRGAHKDRAEYFAKALGAGGSPAWMTQDEVRELDELNPQGGAAATLREPSNVGKPADPPPADDAKAAAMLAEIKSLRQEISAGLAQDRKPIEFKAGDTHVTLPEGCIKLDNHITLPDIKAGDTHVTLPEGCIQLDAHITAPEIKLGDTIVTMPDEMNMHVKSMPTRETLSKVERDDDKNITHTTQIEKDKE